MILEEIDDLKVLAAAIERFKDDIRVVFISVFLSR